MNTLSMGGVSTVRVVGGVLPADVVGRALAGGLPGMAADDYHLGSGERISAAAARSWDYLLGVYASFRSTLSAQPDRIATGLTREKWLLLLMRELGYGRVPTTTGGHISAGDDGDVRRYPVSHVWADIPVHLMGWGIDLDRRTEGVAGAARAPQAMVQELLNRSDKHLWALLSNGRVLRMLRDSSALVGQAYVEFDLEAMFDGELFSDFVALYTMCHQSRLELLSGDDPIPVTNRWIERWRDNAISTGTRALQDLRRGVEQAIEVLGTGFYQNPANWELRDRLANGEVSAIDFQRALLRQAYRLLFWFVIEERGLLFDPTATEDARDRYSRYFSSTRLRQHARRSPGSRHHDLWRQVRLVQRGLASVDGLPELGLPAMGGLFEHTALDVTDDCELANSHLLTAVRLLSTTRDKSGIRTVDFAHLGAEELGGIYEGLLELHPSLDAGTGEFCLTTGAGNERKTSGSYYTPSDLIALVLDEALDPVLDMAGHDEQALLSVTVCDPACGSGHFLVAAARRIAVRLAAVRSGESEPTPSAVQAAIRDVVSNCIYGVDLNPMAAELAKVSLWLEAVEPGKPMAFLDANIRVGNALLGTTPALLATGVPDEAFVALTGDDKKVVAALKKENKRQRQQAERGEQHDTLFGVSAEAKTNRELAAKLSAITAGLTDASLSDLHQAAKRLSDFEGSPERQKAITSADAWCAAFTQPKNAETEQAAVTDEVVRALTDGTGVHPGTLALVHAEATQHRFFHWHLEFPQIFDSGESASQQGWSGGFTVMIGNPPWERVKLQEKEYFNDVPEIAAAPNAAVRKRLIKALPDIDPGLWDAWQRASRRAESTSHFLRLSGRYPLTGAGDVNTYQVFAETAVSHAKTTGWFGIITPTGLVSDKTTAPFIRHLLGSQYLRAFHEFGNEKKIFAAVKDYIRFAVTVGQLHDRSGPVVFSMRSKSVAEARASRFSLTSEEILLLNPNTGTLPVLRSRRDAEITIGIYRRHPVLIREDAPNGNRWGLSFKRMFDMANDSGLFHTAEEMEALGAEFDGWSWARDGKRWLPLYEAKMVSLYDHRFSTYAGATEANLNEGTLPRLNDAQHADPWCEPLARYWVEEGAVVTARAMFGSEGWLLGWRDIARASDVRTLVPAALPVAATGNKLPLVQLPDPLKAACLQAIWSSLPMDYVARQKLSGAGMTYFILKQLACPSPEVLKAPTRWSSEPFADWLLPRVLQLTYTSYRMTPYARALGYEGDPFVWDPESRAALRAEIDAAMMHVYGLTREEVVHVLDSFEVLRKYDERDHGEFRTKRLVLEFFDEMLS
ncbi:MAG: N-6 DNA methylase [Candidatus Nanopelagicales bacterium]|nr:N-6 DNA methylase [Candidatus Nanopelagicales bacterium]